MVNVLATYVHVMQDGVRKLISHCIEHLIAVHEYVLLASHGPMFPPEINKHMPLLNAPLVVFVIVIRVLVSVLPTLLVPHVNVCHVQMTVLVMVNV